MGGRGAVSNISTSNSMGRRNSATYIFTEKEVKAFNDELPTNSSNKDVRELFNKKIWGC